MRKIFGPLFVPRALSTAVIDSSTNIVRHPIRSAIASIGTFVGVALLVALIVVSASARNSVSVQFNSELATEVSFVTNSSGPTTGLVTDASVERVARLHGVVNAGLIDEIDGYNPIAVSRIPFNGDGQNGIEHLPFLMATPSALGTMHITLSSGRLYDVGMVDNGESVGLLGAVAAKQLGISDLSNFPAVFVGSLPITIIGIVNNVSQQSEVLDGVIIPPNLFSALSNGPSSPEVIVQTRPGAAQLVGREGLVSVSPLHPASISAIVPPDPTTLRNGVEGTVSGLVEAIAATALFVGFVIITNTTLLAVIQRRREIGVRRVCGATPIAVALLVVAESTILGGIGGLLGMSVGVLAATLIANVHAWVLVVNWFLVFSTPFVGIMIGCLAGLAPAIKSSRITPLEALR